MTPIITLIRHFKVASIDTITFMVIEHKHFKIRKDWKIFSQSSQYKIIVKIILKPLTLNPKSDISSFGVKKYFGSKFILVDTLNGSFF